MSRPQRSFLLLAVIVLSAGLANGQVGVAYGTANSLLSCIATVAGAPELRPESYSELTGDIVISCTGGPVLQQGAAIATANVVVYMSPAVPITSRFLGPAPRQTSSFVSDALLIIDEAGSRSLPARLAGMVRRPRNRSARARNNRLIRTPVQP